ncbi:MAG: N-formylglutamate deformylase [Longimicrobiales bacterium]
MNETHFTLHRGQAPLLVSLPHAGTAIPDELAPRFRDEALAVPDTDWHVDALYAFARGLGASLVVPRHSRYVIDLNRPAANAPMYPGMNNTSLVPMRSFGGAPLYRDGKEPTASEIALRLATYWRPFHDALANELARIKTAHGHALLWEGHSIRSRLPWLFEGKLPDLNLGTADEQSCAPTLRAALRAVLESQRSFTHVVDGRFKGGYNTRHYGRPREGVHAVQLEMCWSCYMDETPPYTVDPARAALLEPVLGGLIQAALDWRPDA